MPTGLDQMTRYISAFPAMWDEMWTSTLDFPDHDGPAPSALLLCGMGGSSIGGALLKGLLGDQTRLPIEINRDYSVPLWADERALAVFTSYSGNTEETLSAFDTAGSIGAQRFAITTGGTLASLCERQGVPFARIPGGLPPRAALPYTLVPLLHLARRLDVAPIKESDIEQASALLHVLGEVEREGQSTASRIAKALAGRIPVVYSGPGLMSAVNLRWRGQLQENAKSLAFGNVYPELNHNEIVGWQSSDFITKDCVVIELADSDDPPAIRKRMDLTRSLLEAKAADWITVQSEGEGRLARMMRAVLLGDWVSLKLAELKGDDPMPVDLIDALKAGLAAS